MKIQDVYSYVYICSERTIVIIVDTQVFVVIDAMLSRHPAEFFVVLSRHVELISLSGKDNASVVLKDRQVPTPKHEHVVTLIWPGQYSPVLNL